MNTLFYIFLVFLFSRSFSHNDNVLSLADKVIALTERGVKKERVPLVKKKIKKKSNKSNGKQKIGKVKSSKLCQFKKIKKECRDRFTRSSFQRVSHRLL